jgi:hypothetical protein
MITIEPQVFYGVIGSAITMLATALAFWLRSNANSSAYREKSRADGSLLQEQSQAAITSAMVDAVKLGNVFQQKMIEVVQENTRANEKNSAEMRGMVTMMDGFGTVLKNAVIGWDDTQGQIPVIRENTAQIPAIRENVQAIQTVTASLETNLGESIGESIKDQLAPAVSVLMSIDSRLTSLVADSIDRDGRTNNTLIELMTVVKEVRTDFLQRIERLVLQDIKQFLPPDKPSNTTSSIEVNHKETLEEKEL